MTTENLPDDLREPKSNHSTWLLFWCLAFATALPLALVYYFYLWKLEHYRFFPFAILASGWLIHSFWDFQWMPPRGWTGWVGAVVGVVLACLATYAGSPWLGVVGFVAIVFAFCYSSYDNSGTASLVRAALPLMLTIRLPINYDQLLVINLQRITTTLSSVVLDLPFLGVPHAVANNVIQLPTKELFVAEACSGIQSVFTLMFISVTLLAINRRSILATPLYLAISIILAVATNVTRVCSVAVAESWMEMDLSVGWQHELIGYLALGAGALLLISFDYFFCVLIHPIHEGGSEGNPFLSLWNSFVFERADDDGGHLHRSGDRNYDLFIWKQPYFRYAVLGLFAVLALGSSVQAYRKFARTKVYDATYVYFGTGKRFAEFPANLLDERLTTLKVVDHEVTTQSEDPRLGANADVWNCTIKGLNVECRVIISQPYVEWHELCLCYQASNWMLLDRSVIGSTEETITMNEDNDSRRSPYVYSQLRSKSGADARGYLLYSALTPSGEIVAPPANPGFIAGRVEALFNQNEPAETVMMIQLLVTVNSKLDSLTFGKIKDDFTLIRQLLQQKMKEQRPTS